LGYILNGWDGDCRNAQPHETLSTHQPLPSHVQPLKEEQHVQAFDGSLQRIPKGI